MYHIESEGITRGRLQPAFVFHGWIVWDAFSKAMRSALEQALRERALYIKKRHMPHIDELSDNE